MCLFKVSPLRSFHIKRTSSGNAITSRFYPKHIIWLILIISILKFWLAIGTIVFFFFLNHKKDFIINNSNVCKNKQLTIYFWCLEFVFLSLKDLSIENPASDLVTPFAVTSWITVFLQQNPRYNTRNKIKIR